MPWIEHVVAEIKLEMRARRHIIVSSGEADSPQSSQGHEPANSARAQPVAKMLPFQAGADYESAQSSPKQRD